MPVTAKLSRNFYDRFGDEIANELVTWFNMIDSTYRADLRDLSDRHYERFESRLAEALADQGSALRREMAEQGAAIRGEMAEQGAAIRGEMAELGAALRKEIAEQGASLRVEMARESAALRTEMAGMEERLGQRMSSLEVRMARESVVQTRWMIGLWAAQITAFVGTILIVLQR